MFESTLHALIQHIRSNAELIERLWNTYDPKELFDLLFVVAKERGDSLHRDEMFPRIQNNISEEISLSDTNLDGCIKWYPSSIEWYEGRLMVEWCYVGDHRFDEPFYHDTMRGLMSKPINRLIRFRSSIDIFKQTSNPLGINPTGFIFHCSRCGSSLLSRMLASLPQCIVISEALPIDSILRSQVQNEDVCIEDVSVWLKGLIQHFGRPRRPEEKYYFIKFDSWHILYLPFIQKIFPDVPWIFLCRSPGEVLVSHQRVPGYQMVPGLIEPEWYGWKASDLSFHSMEGYRARVLGRIYQSATEYYQPKQSRLINYTQLPEIVCSSLLDWFGVEYTEERLVKMREISSFNAKSPSFQFEPDSMEKQQTVTPIMKECCDRWATSWYDRLEELRLDSERK